MTKQETTHANLSCTRIAATAVAALTAGHKQVEFGRSQVFYALCMSHIEGMWEGITFEANKARHAVDLREFYSLKTDTADERKIVNGAKIAIMHHLFGFKYHDNKDKDGGVTGQDETRLDSEQYIPSRLMGIIRQCAEDVAYVLQVWEREKEHAPVEGVGPVIDTFTKEMLEEYKASLTAETKKSLSHILDRLIVGSPRLRGDLAAVRQRVDKDGNRVGNTEAVTAVLEQFAMRERAEKDAAARVAGKQTKGTAEIFVPFAKRAYFILGSSRVRQIEYRIDGLGFMSLDELSKAARQKLLIGKRTRGTKSGTPAQEVSKAIASGTLEQLAKALGAKISASGPLESGSVPTMEKVVSEIANRSLIPVAQALNVMLGQWDIEKNGKPSDSELASLRALTTTCVEILVKCGINVAEMDEQEIAPTPEQIEAKRLTAAGKTTRKAVAA